MVPILYLTSYTTLLIFVITFFLATILRNNSIVDILWGLGFVVIAWLSYFISPHTLVSILTLICVSLWGLRLAIHITLRNWGKGEDFRYLAWRQQWGRLFVVRSFFQVFLLQWFLMQLVSIPIVLAMTPSQSPPSLFFLALGSLIWGIGFFFEVVGDYQLSVFKQNKSNKGKLMTTGLWSLTRHPNYFGEATLWWGIAILAYIQSSNYLVFLGPLTIDFLLLYVSGIPLLEAKYQGRKDWVTYAGKTPAFFPKFKVA